MIYYDISCDISYDNVLSINNCIFRKYRNFNIFLMSFSCGISYDMVLLYIEVTDK